MTEEEFLTLKKLVNREKIPTEDEAEEEEEEDSTCAHPSQDEINIDFCDDGMYRRLECLRCGDKISSYYELVNIHNDTKGVEELMPGKESERETNVQRYMLLGCYVDYARPNMEVIYIDTDLEKVRKVKKLIEKISNWNKEKDGQYELLEEVRQYGLAIANEYEQVWEIENLEIIERKVIPDCEAEEEEEEVFEKKTDVYVAEARGYIDKETAEKELIKLDAKEEDEEEVQGSMMENAFNKGLKEISAEEEETNGKGSYGYQVVIEGHDYEQMQNLFEEIQNKYCFYDNCVIQEIHSEDTLIDSDRRSETGFLIIKEK